MVWADPPKSCANSPGMVSKYCSTLGGGCSRMRKLVAARDGAGAICVDDDGMQALSGPSQGEVLTASHQGGRSRPPCGGIKTDLSLPEE